MAEKIVRLKTYIPIWHADQVFRIAVFYAAWGLVIISQEPVHLFNPCCAKHSKSGDLNRRYPWAKEIEDFRHFMPCGGYGDIQVPGTNKCYTLIGLHVGNVMPVHCFCLD